MDFMSSTSAADLTGPEKAAIIVRLLSGDDGPIPLASLSREAQKNLTKHFLKLGKVDTSTVDAVVEEFEAKLTDPSLNFPREMQKTLSLLEDHLSPEVALELRRSAGLTARNDPWPSVSEVPVQALAAIMLQEGHQVGAIMLSKLSPERASEVLELIPEDTGKTLTYAVQETAGVPPAVVARIGMILAEMVRPKGVKAFEETPVERVAEILNAAISSQRDGLLEQLEGLDAPFTAEVRQAIFTFEDIPTRITNTDIPKIVREVDNDVLIIALAAAQPTMPESVDFILANMSQRLADSLREEMADAGSIKTKPGEQAMGQITGTIRRLKDQGDIAYITSDEEENA